MKKLAIILFLSLSYHLMAQTQCVSLASYNDTYLNTVSMDDVTYPPGGAFITSGNIQYKKHDINDMYQFIQGDSLLYIGDIDIDISTAPCADRTLTFSIMFVDGVIVDGDTVFYMATAPTTYTGAGFTLTRTANNYTVTGNFDVVSLTGSTNFLFDVCLTCNSASSGGCVSLDAYDNAYLNTVTFDDVTYPPGSAFITSGDIQYLKHDSNDMYQFIYGDTLMYIGDIDIDVSNSTCPNRTLTFSVIYLQGLAVDGDTIFYMGSAPASYTGTGFTMTMVGNNYTITGDFDVVTLSSSTNFLFDVCLSCGTLDCVSLDAYDNAYLNTISMDDVTYPPGYAFVTSGDIQYRKHDINDMYQFIYGDTLMYIGDLDIDISTATCTNKTLTFSVIYLEGMVVDGDTIFYMGAAPASYTGVGFTLTLVGNHYTIDGDFDVVTLISSTNFLFDVCLACDGVMGIEEDATLLNQVHIYPNPTTDILFIETNQFNIGKAYSIYDYSGKLILTGSIGEQLNAIYTTQLSNGIYFLRIDGLNQAATKFIKQ